MYDPLVSAPVGHIFSRGADFCALQNVLCCNKERATIDPRATELLPRSRVSRPLLREFMDGVLSQEHALQRDYGQLHHGSQYRTLMVAMLTRSRERKAAASVAVTSASTSGVIPSPEISPDISPVTSSDISLGLQPPMVATASSPADASTLLGGAVRFGRRDGGNANPSIPGSSSRLSLGRLSGALLARGGA